ncbi:MAG: carboxyl transferase domain-containing protein, partial [Myxococcota bacterium]
AGAARIQESFGAMAAGMGPRFGDHFRMSGQVPQVAAALGAAFGGPSFTAAQSDFVTIARGTGFIGMSGPLVVKVGTGETVTSDEIGGDRADAFHLVIPSMPGFGFSDKPTEPGWAPPRIARAWIELMDRLGYDRWGAQGGDLGAAVADEIARLRPDPLVGVHSNFAMFKPDEGEIAAATPEERAMLADSGYFWEKLSGYAKEQATRPQTIGYSLADSPVGLAAWIYAMFQDTCGTPGDAEGSFDRDEMLDDIMLYWLPNAGASAARLYWEMETSGWRPTATTEDPIEVPFGFTMLPREHVRKSRRWIERRYPNLVHFDEAEAGGHFAALEQPEIMVTDIRATFRGLR